MRQGGAGHPGDADHVDVQHAVPLLIRVVLDGSGSADPGVVYQDVQEPPRAVTAAPMAWRVEASSATSARRPVIGSGAPVGSRSRTATAAPGEASSCAVAEADAGGAAGDDGAQAGELAHAVAGAARSAVQNVPSGYVYSVIEDACIWAEKPGVLGAA